MKKNIFGVMSLMLCAAVFVTGCGSTKVESGQIEKKASAKKQKSIEYENIDWDGAVVGKDPAEWPFSLKDNGLDGLENYPGILGKIGNKHYFLTEGENTNKKLAREEARNELSFQIAQQLNTSALDSFDRVIDNREQAQETIGGIASEAKFTGFERIAETWFFRLKTDHTRKDKATEEYSYYCLYVIAPDVFQPQCDKYLSDVIGKIVKSENQQEAEKIRKELVNQIHDNGIPQQTIE